MENIKRALAILNLAGDLSSEMDLYFSSKSISVSRPEDELKEWSHILVRDEQDFEALNKQYNILSKKIKIISLKSVADLKGFIAHNGQLIFDELWFQSSMADFILDKFFQEFAGVALTDNYPTFEEKGSFNITNPFSTGEYLDRVVYHAFEADMSGLSVKTFFDHLIMYLAGLKTKNKIGMPIEVTYGVYNEAFGVQLHFFTQTLQLKDVTSSLSNNITKVPEEYLLNIAIQSSDFFDFTYLEQVNKAVITALWTKDKKFKLENRGLMFSSLSSSAALTSLPTEGETSFLIQNSINQDMSDKINLPTESQESESDVIDKFTASIEMDEIQKLISGDLEDEAFSQMVSGMIDSSVATQTIAGASENLDDVVNIVKGKMEEQDDFIHHIPGEKFDVDKFAYRIAADASNKGRKDDIMKVKSLGNGLSENLKKGLFDFAAKLNKSVDDLTEKDMMRFKDKEIPEILKQQAVQARRQELMDKVKAELQQKLKNEFEGGTPGEIEAIREILKKTIKETLVENGADSAESTSDKPVDKELEKKYKMAMMEAEQLKTKVKTLMSEVRIQKEAKAQMVEAHERARQASMSSELSAPLEINDAGKSQIMEKITAKSFTEDDVAKLKVMMDKDKQTMELIKQEGIRAKKIQLEAIQKETFFAQELEKNQREIKAKDLLLLKAKEVATKIMEKKEAELTDLKVKLEQASKVLASGNSQALALQLRDLEKQNMNQNKMLEMYKNKITSLSTSLESNKSDDGNFKEEARKLQMLNTQMKNQIDISKRETQKIQDRSTADATLILSMKTEKVKLEQLLKKAAQDAPKEQATILQLETELKKSMSQAQIFEGQVKDAVTRVKDLEQKLVEAAKHQKAQATGDEGSKVKVTQLENSLKKLTQDLLESRNQMAEMKKETNKLRQEKTAMQNQIDKYKKDAEKTAKAAPSTAGGSSADAMPKKPGGKAA